VYRNTASGVAVEGSVSDVISDVTHGASVRGVIESIGHSAPMENVQVW